MHSPTHPNIKLHDAYLAAVESGDRKCIQATWAAYHAAPGLKFCEECDDFTDIAHHQKCEDCASHAPAFGDDREKSHSDL